MPTVNVKPELIRWAINRSGLSTDELREKFPKLGDWESGDRLPTFRQLQEFARKTMTPFGMLLLDEPPREELAVPDFRTVGDTPIRRASPNLIDTIQETWVFSEDFMPEAKTEFASVADGWVIAYARVNDLTVVTHEEYAPEAKKRVPMPNVCLEFDVPYVNTYKMLDDLKVQFVLRTKRAKRR